MSDPRRSAPGRPPDGFRVSRRDALGGLLCLPGLAGVAALGAACKAPARVGATVRVSIASLPEGARLRVLLHGDPIEVRRTAEGVAARTLLCTHQGCEVRWEEKLSRYRCPCHQGMYSAEGVPISGPPSRPLAAVPASIVGSEVVVGEETKG